MSTVGKYYGAVKKSKLFDKNLFEKYCPYFYRENDTFIDDDFLYF